MPKKATRNAQGAGTIRQRPDGRWEARYTTGRDPGTGKQVQRSIYGDTQKGVRQKLQKVCSDIDGGVYRDPSRITVGEWLEIWLKEYTGSAKPFTVDSYMRIIKLHIKPFIGALKLQALTAPAIQRLYNKLGIEDGERAALAPKSIKNVHGVLHKALEQAVMIGYIKFNPSDACTLPRVERKEIKPLGDDDLRLFLDAIKGHPYERLFITDIFTGMRKGEILGLTWDCVDFTNGCITVSKQLQREKKKNGVFYWASLKNDKIRIIKPAATVMETLRQQFRVQLDQKRKAGELWQPGDFPFLVFTNEFGQHLDHGYVWRQFKKIVVSLGLPETRFHDMRHTYAVMSIQAGDDIKTVQENLGHATAAFTLDVYGHVTEQMKQDSADRMEKFIKKVIG